jgi:hypothetical protein
MYSYEGQSINVDKTVANKSLFGVIKIVARIFVRDTKFEVDIK